MEKRSIGSLQVSVVGLGCNNFGRRLDEEQTRHVVDATIDAGVNFFDTADIYGGTKSEEFLGRILGSRRGQIVLATKFGMEVDEKRKGAHPDYVKRACEDSLRRLQTDYIDLYQLHEPDPSVPIGETLQALDDLVKAGKVREIGCSNFSVEQLKEAESSAQGARFVSVQNHYSLFHRAPESDGVLDYAEQEGIAFIPFFPLASGLLSGKYRKGEPLPEGTRIQAGSDWVSEAKLDVVEKLTEYAEANGHSILELSIGYLLAHRAVVSVIAGATKPEQVKANAEGASWKLTEQNVAEIAEITSTL